MLLVPDLLLTPIKLCLFLQRYILTRLTSAYWRCHRNAIEIFCMLGQALTKGESVIKSKDTISVCILC